MKPWLTEICERVNARRDNPPNTQQDALDALDATFASYVSSQCGDLISCLIERCEALAKHVEAYEACTGDAACACYAHCKDKIEWLRRPLKWAANLKPDIELAQLANDGAEFREDFCTCDPDVGMSPCQYCVIHDVLRRTLELSQHCAAVLDAIEGRGGTIDEILAEKARGV